MTYKIHGPAIEKWANTPADLFTYTPPPGPRDGVTFEKAKDGKRLNRQAQLVWNFMSDGRYHSLAEISRATGAPEASASARLRDARKLRFGMHTVERRRRTEGTWEYKLIERAP